MWLHGYGVLLSTLIFQNVTYHIRVNAKCSYTQPFQLQSDWHFHCSYLKLCIMFLDLSSRVLCETTVSLKSLYILRILWLILLLHYFTVISTEWNHFIFKSDLGTLYFYIYSQTKHGKNCEERKTTSPIYIKHHRILIAVERKEKNQETKWKK